MSLAQTTAAQWLGIREQHVNFISCHAAPLSMDLSLHRISKLVRDYHAVLPWKAIHIAGTNGKGTTAAFISAFLHQKGFKVGRFNSPHLKHRHDCIVLNERPVDKDLFLEVERLVKSRDAEANLGATSFELLTATAFEIFACQQMQVAVVECGLGGRLDATNILRQDEVLCCAITKISLDHQHMLGNTVEEIAAEKAGIFKFGVPVVYDRGNVATVENVLTKRAEECRSTHDRSYDDSRGTEWPLSLLDDSQLKGELSARQNLAVAVRIYYIIREHGGLDLPELSQEDLRTAVTRVKNTWQGRLQWADLSRLLRTTRPTTGLLDGAHNAQGARRLRQYVDQTVLKDRRRPMVWVLALSAGKDANELMSELIHEGDQVVVTEFGEVDGMPWVKPQASDDLQSIASNKTSKTVIARPQPSEALKAAFESAPEGALVVIAGSLYLIGQVLRELEEAGPATEGS